MVSFGHMSLYSFGPERVGDWLEKRGLQVAHFYANICRISGLMIVQEKGSSSKHTVLGIYQTLL